MSLCRGGWIYTEKNSPFKLVEAIDEVKFGGAPLSPAIAKKVLFSFCNKQKPVGQRFHLTTKESEILQLLVKGFSVKLIAAEKISAIIRHVLT